MLILFFENFLSLQLSGAFRPSSQKWMMGKFCNHFKDGTVRSLFLHCNCGGSSHPGEIVQGEGGGGGRREAGPLFLFYFLQSWN